MSYTVEFIIMAVFIQCGTWWIHGNVYCKHYRRKR